MEFQLVELRRGTLTVAISQITNSREYLDFIIHSQFKVLYILAVDIRPVVFYYPGALLIKENWGADPD